MMKEEMSQSSLLDEESFYDDFGRFTVQPSSFSSANLNGLMTPPRENASDKYQKLFLSASLSKGIDGMASALVTKASFVPAPVWLADSLFRR